VIKEKMMPLAPTTMSMALPTSKPKIGFSIDNLIGAGNRKTKSPPFSPNSEGSDRPSSPLSDCSYPNQQKSPKLPTSPAELHRALRLNEYAQLELQQRLRRSSDMSLMPPSTDFEAKGITRLSEASNPGNSPPPPQTRLSPGSNTKEPRTPSPSHPQNPKGPIVVPGFPPSNLVRPYPVNVNEMKPAMASYPPPEMMASHNPFLAAQFQAAAALAHAQVSQFPPGSMPPHPAHMHNPNIPRESYPLYPWLLSRHGRIFPHRFPGSE
jgi:homeobox protein EMX